MKMAFCCLTAGALVFLGLGCGPDQPSPEMPEQPAPVDPNDPGQTPNGYPEGPAENRNDSLLPTPDENPGGASPGGFDEGSSFDPSDLDSNGQASGTDDFSDDSESGGLQLP